MMIEEKERNEEKERMKALLKMMSKAHTEYAKIMAYVYEELNKITKE